MSTNYASTVALYGVKGGALFIGLSLADWGLCYGLVRAGIDFKQKAIE